MMEREASESQQWEIYTNLHQGDVNYVRFSELGLNGKKIVDIYGVVTSVSVSKCSGSASHKYCFSITLVDPSLEQLCQSVRLNWFANINTLNVQVGDIIRCLKLKVQQYREYPQFTGNSHHSPMVIFRLNRDPVTGVPLDVPTENMTHEIMITNLIQNKTRTPEVSCGNWSRLLPTEGDISLHSLSPRDVHFVLMLHKWSEKALYEQTLADDAVPDIPIHAALAHLNKQQSAVYCSLNPPADPLLLRGMPTAPITTERCNLVCLIVGVLPPSEVLGPAGGLLLWDGTARGMLNLPSSEATARVDASLHAAKDFSCSEKHQDMGEAIAKIVRRQTDSSVAAGAAAVGSSVPLVGSALLVKAGDHLGGELITARRSDLLPGTWIRVRNLHIELGVNANGSVSSSSSGSEVKYATVHNDTHFTVLQPFYHDVTSVVRTYYLRVLNVFLADASAATSSAAGSTAAAAAVSAGSTTGTTTTSGHRGVKRRADGAPITWLAMTLVKDLPAVYDTLCSVVDWFPEQVDKFVVESTGEGAVDESADENVNRSNEPAASGGQQQLLFALRLADETEELDVVLSGADAEQFLGVTTAQFAANEDGIQERVRARLEELTNSREERDFTLLAYATEEDVVVPDRSGRRTVTQRKTIRRFVTKDCKLFA